MTELINHLIDAYNFPILTAFLLGVLTSISPCPLATNITAIAYISREIKTSRSTLLNGLAYTLGRSVSYMALAAMIFFGLSSFSIASFFQGWGDKILGPVLIIIGLFMAGIVKLDFKQKNNEELEKLKIKLAQKGYVGAFLLGVLFALAFCPYSGVIFFGILVPLVVKSKEGLMLPPFFALGTGLPVIVFSFLIAFSFQKLGQAFQMMQKIEKIMRYGVAATFLATGIYYTQFLIKFLINL